MKDTCQSCKNLFEEHSSSNKIDCLLDLNYMASKRTSTTCQSCKNLFEEHSREERTNCMLELNKMVAENNA